MPELDGRSVLRVAIRIGDPGLRADILDRLEDRAGLRVVDGLETADVVVGDGSDREEEGDEASGGSDPPVVTVLEGRAVRAPPAGSIVLADASATLLEAVLRVTSEGYVARPEGWMDEGGEGETEDTASDPGDLHRLHHPQLTPREREVLALLAEGAPNKVIARRLQIAPSTAKFHVASLLEKLGARSRLDAVAIGVRLGLVLL